MSKFKAYYAIFVAYLALTIILNALKLDAIWEDPFDEEQENDTGEVAEKIINLYDGKFELKNVKGILRLLKSRISTNRLKQK